MLNILADLIQRRWAAFAGSPIVSRHFSLRVKNIRGMYRVKMTDEDATIILSKELIETYANNFGDASCGVVNILLRAICEYYAKEYIRIESINTVEYREERVGGSVEAAEALLRLGRAWNLPSDRIDVQEVKETVTRHNYSVKSNSQGWFTVFAYMVRSLAGSMPQFPYFPKYLKKTPEKGDFWINSETLEAFRCDHSPEDRASNHKRKHTSGLTVNLPGGKVHIPAKEA